MEFDITQIAVGLISLLATVLTMMVIPWLQAKVGTAKWERMILIIKVAVKAAEQLYQGSGKGEEKKAFVIAWLAERNIRFDEEAIAAAIEAAVFELKNGA